MSSNIQRLGDTLSGRMSKTAKSAVPTTVELGTIGSNLSLTTDSMKTPIPKGQYMVNLFFGGSYSTSYADDHSHSVTLRSLKKGDRVLVIWCGNEPVVAAIVVSS